MTFAIVTLGGVPIIIVEPISISAFLSIFISLLPISIG